MDVVALKTAVAPAKNWRLAHVALWYAAHNEWDRAHDTVQQGTGADVDWVHAHLHRVEGDLGNAAYWYRRAKQPVPNAALALTDEWEHIATELLRDIS